MTTLHMFSVKEPLATMVALEVKGNNTIKVVSLKGNHNRLVIDMSGMMSGMLCNSGITFGSNEVDQKVLAIELTNSPTAIHIIVTRIHFHGKETGQVKYT